MALLGIAVMLLLISMYYSQLASMRYLNYLCPTMSDCTNINNAYLDLSRAFGISGGAIGAIGAWLAVTGLRPETMQKARQ
jgi:hypothetical protein